MEDSMSTNTQIRRFHWLGAATVAALALTATVVPLTQAKAQIGIEVGPVGIGVGPYYGYYYGPRPYYHGYYDPYWHHYYYGW
jgi:hypothetical protein